MQSDNGSVIDPNKPAVERLFPFVLRARLLIAGRPALARARKHLQFVLITKDVSENSQRQILQNFKTIPIIQCYESADLKGLFGLNHTKVVGFKKSSLARSIYSELKSSRIHNPFADS